VAPAAVILPADGVSAETTVEALDHQSLRPGRIIVVGSAAEFSEAIQAASECDPSWVWLLDSGVLPEPTALESLLAAAESGPAVALLVSKVLAPGGTVDLLSLPVPEVHRGDRVLTALEHRAVPLRVARRGSMLVRHEAVQQLDAGQALDRDLEWTARLLRREPGLLAPTSVVVRAQTTRRTARAQVASTLRLLAALEPRERLWFAVHFGEQALISRRARKTR
jgi:GT2 family glycosyltransferase